MRVFVAGATGAIGRPLVERLLTAGHEVTGMTRSAERAEALSAAGATPAVCDVYDRDAVHAALAAARPEVVVNELTDIPRVLNPREYANEMAGLNRIRREGYANLVAAAQAAGAARIVAQSIAFVYHPAPGLAAEEDPLWTDAPAPLDDTVAAVQDAERTVLDAGGLVLRYGWFYGPGTTYAADGGIAHQVRLRRYPVVGNGAGVNSLVHVDDAADATVAAVASTVSGVLNVVDDDPAPLRELLPALAQNLGAKPPRRVPAIVARLAVGRYAEAFSTRQRGASNARAKAVLGWEPAHPSWRKSIGR